MLKLMNLQKVKVDLKPLKELGDVVIFGSYATGHATQRSDIDVAIITHSRDRESNKELWWQALGKTNPAKYDVKVFELLPLPVQMSVIENYVVVFGNRLDLSEYFYFYRKLWRDVEPRYLANQFKSVKEKKKALANVCSL